ncbi:MAG: hypothetical protein O3B66_01580 [Actinomycetota bacterium]|nr:hypothetical protein [Actinomycetota bacterium]
MTESSLGMVEEVSSLTALKQAQLRASRLRPAAPEHARPSADIIPLHRRIPATTSRPGLTADRTIIRRFDHANRITCHGVAEQLGWAPGALRVSRLGTWFALTPYTGTQPRRHRDLPKVTADGRITVPTAVRTILGDEALLVVDVANNRLLLADPNQAFLALVAQLEGLGHE